MKQEELTHQAMLQMKADVEAKAKPAPKAKAKSNAKPAAKKTS